MTHSQRRSHGARALPARPTAPVLAGMRLQAGNELNLSTFDYEVSARSIIRCRQTSRGRVLVSGGCSPEIVRRCPPSRSTSPPTGPGRRQCGSATFTLLLLPAEEYPTLPNAGHNGHRRRRRVRLGHRPGRHRRRPGRHAARADRHQDGVRRGHADAGRHRPVPAGGPRAALDAGRARPEHRGSRPCPGPRRHRAADDRWRRGLRGALHDGGRSDGIIGFEGGGRRTTTRLLSGEYPVTRPCCPASSPRSRSCPRRRSRTPSSASPSSPSGTRRSG